MSGDLREPDQQLRHELDASRRYWLSDGREGAPFIGVEADLSHVDLGERTLSGAQLQGANLRGARLDQAILVRADLAHAHLDGARLFKADASRASLVGAALQGVTAQLSRWVGAAMTGVDLRDADLTHADLQRAELIDADLSGARLRETDLRGALLGSARLDGADVAYANLDDAVLAPAARSAVRGFEHITGEPAWLARPLPSPAGDPPKFRDRELLERVLEALRTERVRTYTMDDRGGLPDIVVEQPRARRRSFVALDVHPAPSDEWLALASRRADAVVVRGAPRSTGPGGITLIDFERLSSWVRKEGTRVSPLRGATAIAVRQAARLRPYLAIARRAAIDPTFSSRLAVWIDAGRADFPMPSSEQRLADDLPTHLDGASAVRGLEWAAERLDDLARFEHEARTLWRTPEVQDATRAVELADEGLKREQELAQRIFASPG